MASQQRIHPLILTVTVALVVGGGACGGGGGGSENDNNANQSNLNQNNNNSPPQVPVAVDDQGTTEEDTAVIIDVLVNDVAPQGDTIVVQAVTPPRFGEARILADGRVEYSPPAFFNGADEFDYTVVAETGGGTATARVAVDVTPVGVDFYVSPSGDDNDPGTLDLPFATLERARTALRDLKSSDGLGVGGVAIWLRGGTYERSTTFALDAQDSGEADKPVVLIGYPGETARIVGGARLDPSWFTEVTDADGAIWDRLDPTARGQVLKVDLGAHGVSDYGQLQSRGFTIANLAALELSWNGDALDLARWPDRGENDASQGVYSGLATIVGPVTTTSIHYSGDRPSRWTQAEEIWLHGLWRYWWADLHASVATIDTSTKTIQFDQAIWTGVEAGKAYYALNLLEEITVPGEWYLHRSTGVLYVWPPTEVTSAEIVVSLMPQKVVRLNGTSYVQVRDLTIASGRGILAEIAGGSNNRLVGCQIRNAGTDAVAISGTHNGIERSTIAHAGESAVKLYGGDRPTLARADNFVRNCDIHHFGRWVWMYSAGVSIPARNSVGHVIANNELHDAPHSAVIFGGNETLVELNEIHHVCQFSSDAGAIYSGHDWGYRGNLIRHNSIHHIHSAVDGFGVHGVYLDGAVAGFEVFGNIFYEIQDFAIHANGGRDTIMHNNVMARCGRALEASSRGLIIISNTPGALHNMLERLSVVPYQGALWSAAYPELAVVPNDWSILSNPSNTWLYPEDCVFSRNVGLDAGTPWLQESNYGGTGTFNKYQEMDDNLELDETDPLFVDEAGGDLSLDPASPAFSIPGFVDIPFEDMGIQP